MEKDGRRRKKAELGETLEFMRLLWSLDHALQRTSKRMARDLGVTGPQRLVIRILGNRPGATAGEVARILKVHPSTLTGILQRLEERKIVRRVADAKDGRRALLHLQGRGERLQTARSGTVEAAVKRGLAKLSEAQLTAARRAIETLVHELEADLPADRGGKGDHADR